MTPLNNQELKEKIAGIYDNPEDPEYCLEDLISEKAMNQLLALFESELANRERVAESRIAKSLHDRIFNNFDMLPRIQTAYTGDRNIDVRKLQKVICEFRDNLQNLPVYGD